MTRSTDEARDVDHQTGYMIDDENRPWFQDIRAYALALIGFLGIFLFGYDTGELDNHLRARIELMAGLGGGVIALKTFTDSFGIEGTPTEIANIKGWVVSILQGGAFFGAIGGGAIEDRIGRKYALMVGCVIFIVGGIVQVVATNGISAGERFNGSALWRANAQSTVDVSLLGSALDSCLLVCTATLFLSVR